MKWHTEIVEREQGATAQYLEDALNRSGTVRYVLSNGVNRWTVVSEAEEDDGTGTTGTVMEGNWKAVIVEGPLPGSPARIEDLSAALNALASEGRRVEFVVINGVNRWTVVCRKES